MNAAASPPGSWSKVERITSLCLISSLLAFIGSRLIFAVWWPMHPVDFILSSLAVTLLTASFWFAAHRKVPDKLRIHRGPAACSDGSTRRRESRSEQRRSRWPRRVGGQSLSWT